MKEPNGPAAVIVGAPGTPVAAGFRKVEQVYHSKVAPLPAAARLFSMTRRQLYSVLFSPIHVTPPGVCWKFRGRHMVDLEKLEAFLRGGTSA